MSRKLDRLSSVDNARIFEENILPALDLDAFSSQKSPRAIVLGGQPGAGKSGLVRSASRELLNDAVLIDPDQLRDFHPVVDRLRHEAPYAWAGRVGSDAAKWSESILDVASSGRKNVIVDGTLSNGEHVSENVIKRLQREGYDVEVRVVAAHKLESELGVEERFIGGIEERGYGRHVPRAVQDAMYEKLPGSLDTIQSKTDVRIRIFSRNGEELFDSIEDPRSAGQALTQSQNSMLQRPQVTERLRSDWSRVETWHERVSAGETVSDKMGVEAHERLRAGQVAEKASENASIRALGSATIDELVRPGAPPALPAVADPKLPSLRRAAGAMGGAGLGLAATAYEAHETGQRVQTLLQEKNATAAKSEALHFAASSLGGWTGGAIAAFAVGSSGAGPMALIAADAYLFSKAFEKAAILRDNHTVYHQTDKAGTEWQYNGYSWVRESMMDRTDDGVDNPIKQQVNATYEKTRELNALANARAVELELGKVPPPQNPFNIPARVDDQRGLDNASWHRNPENGEWARQVKSQVVGANDRGTYTTEVASPERARQLDAEAVDRVQNNISTGREAVAAAYLQHRAEQRFSDFGAAIPAAVTHAQAKPDAVFGSDGQLYQRNEDGRWIHGGKVAQGNLALELELTQQMRQPTLDKAAAALAEVEARPAPTPAEAERSELLHRYQSYNVRLEEDWVPAIELANARTREAHGITGRTVQELQPGADGLYTRDSAIGHYAVGEDGALRRVATTTGEDVRQAYAELQAQHQDAPPIQAVSERRIDALTPQQAEAHEQALREANRQGLSKEEAGQAAMLAAAQLGNREPLQALDAVDIATSASHAERDSTANDAASVEPRPAWLNTPPPQSPPATTPTEQDTSPQQTQQREQEPARAEQERARNEHAAAAENELNAHQAQLRQQPADHSAPAESPATPVHQTTPVEPTTAAPPHTPEAHSQPAPLQEQAQPEPEAPPIHDDQAPKLASQLPIYEAHPEESLPAPEQAYTAVAPEPVASQPEPNLADEPAPGRLEPSDPAHPANALYLQVREQVEKLDERLGRTYDENSERLTDSLMVLAKENGLQRVDHVVLSNQVGDNPAGYNVFVVQGELDNPAHRRAAMPTEQAVTTPHEESMAKLDVLLEQDAEQEQQINQQRQQEHDNMQQEMQFAVMQMGGGGGGG